MQVVALAVKFQEAATYLDGKGKPDEDAFTRGQQKKIEEISSEKPPSKKAKMARDSTMAGTAKVRQLVSAVT